MRYKNQRNGKTGTIIEENTRFKTVIIKFEDGSTQAITTSTLKRWWKPIEDDKPFEPLKPKRGQMITYNGESKNICGWSKTLGISVSTLYNRLYRMNWPIERAFAK